MLRLTPFLLFTCLVTLGIPPVHGEIRTWTDSTGRHETKADFVSLENGKVTLLKDNGKRVTLVLDRLSADDQKLAPRELARKATASPSVSKPNNVINSVRGAAYRAQTMNNMRQIALAAISHESAKGRFPPGALMTSDGKPGLSWRVAILPFMEEDGLYRQFKLNESWDSEHNRKLVERMPKLFLSPGTSTGPGYTNYLAVRMPNSIITPGRGTRIRDVRDGTSKTIMLVEVDDDHAAIWTRPDDYEWNTEQPAAGLGSIWAGRQFFAAFADGHTGRISAAMPAETLRGLFTRNGGERIDLNEF